MRTLSIARFVGCCAIFADLIGCRAALAQPPVKTSTIQQVAPDPVLVKLKGQLDSIFAAAKIDATTRLESPWKDDKEIPPDLCVDYHTRQYLVYGRSMTGRVSMEPHSETGPDYDGIILKIKLKTAAALAAIPSNALPQTALPLSSMGAEYWTRYLNYYDLPAHAGTMRMDLLYGAGTDIKLLAQIDSAIKSFGTPVLDESKEDSPWHRILPPRATILYFPSF